MAKARSPRTAVHRLFEKSEQPVYVLNERRQIVFANAACGKWLDCQIESLLGKTCAYHSGESADAVQHIADLLCPPPDLLSGPEIEGRALIKVPACAQPCRRSWRRRSAEAVAPGPRAGLATEQGKG